MKAHRRLCPAKLNLFLEILGRRSDGYHDLATVMVPLDFGDLLDVREARRFSLEVDGPPLPRDNTLARAYRAVARRRKIPGVRVRLAKRIPAGSGLGGGSSDAAALLRALDRLFDLDLDLREAGAEVGSDVNFFLQDGAALCTGRGEAVAPLTPQRPLHAVVVWTGAPLSTPEVYRASREYLTRRPRNVIEFLNLYARGNRRQLGLALYNRLESAAVELHPGLNTALRYLRRLPFAGTRMTGSGSALYGLCASRREAERLARRVRDERNVFAVAASTLTGEVPWRSPKSG